MSRIDSHRKTKSLIDAFIAAGTNATVSYNSTTDQIIISGPTLNSLSPATTKGDLIAYTGSTNTRLAVGTNYYTLAADSSASTGLAYAWSPRTNTRYGLNLYDDFLNNSSGAATIGSLGWNLTTSGASIAVQQADAANRAGIRRWSTSTAVGNRACIDLGVTSMYASGGAISTEYSVRFVTLPNATDDHVIYIGLHNTTGAGAPTNGVYFIVDQAVTGSYSEIRGRCTKASASTDTTDVSISANTWYRLRIEINAAATSASFYLDDSQVGSAVVSNLPDTSSNLVSPMAVMVRKTVGSNNVTPLDIDYCWFYQTLTTPR